MFTIRHGMFETNSSNNHVFVFKPNENVSIPSTVELIQILKNQCFKFFLMIIIDGIDLIDMVKKKWLNLLICYMHAELKI
jgi:hypothetical protein